MSSLKKLDPSSLKNYIDHTLLRPDATEDEILKASTEAIDNKFKGLCIERKWLRKVKPLLKKAGVLAVTVVSFPAGNATTATKVQETKEAVAEGADEVDMVLNRELLKAKNYKGVLDDVRSVVDAAGAIPVKVILETSELTDEEKVIACGLCVAAGARFVKTSTGFSKSGATVADVALMRRTVGEGIGVKASGGVRSYEDTVKMIEAGATRIGTSGGVAILKGASSPGTY